MIEAGGIPPSSQMREDDKLAKGAVKYLVSQKHKGGKCLKKGIANGFKHQ